MNRIWMRLCATAALGLPLLAALPAHAQYSYIDEHGTRVFSDQPPPPGTPANRILKAPRGAPAPSGPNYGQEAPAPAAAPDAPADKPAAAKPAAPKGPPTLADREADYAKRVKEREKEEAKAAAAAAATAKECGELRRKEMELTSGQRMSRRNAKGEPEYIGDEERARMIAENQRASAKCR